MKKVLIVDDEMLIAINTKNILEKNGYEAITAISGEKAISLIEDGNIPDLILMDIDLGKNRMDGVETTKKIYEKHAIPVVFHSGHTDKETIEKTKSVTKYGYVHKTSMNEMYLLSSIDMALNLYETNRKLIESEKEQRLLFEQMINGVALHEIILDDAGKPVDYRFLKVNQAFEKLTGLQGTNILQKTVLEVLPNLQKSWIEIYGEVALTGKSISFENYSQPIGKHYMVTAYSIQKGQFVTIFEDITERKQTEEKLKANQYYLEKALELGSIGTWENDIIKNKLTWTDESYRIYGVHIGSEVTYETFLNCVHPDDREYVDSKWNAALKNEPYDIEHRVVVDDKIKWVREKGEMEFDERGNCIRGIGFTQDLTIQKKMENKYESIIRTSLDGFWIVDLKGNFLDVKILIAI